MRYIRLFETFLNNLNLDPFYKIAKGNDYDTFLNKTDSLVFKYNILYRGGSDPYDRILFNQCFMADYIGHAREYGDDVNGIIYDYKDLLYFDNYVFNDLREYFEDNKDLKKIIKKVYTPYFSKYGVDTIEINDDIIDVEKFVFICLRKHINFKDACKNCKITDALVPIMLYYANIKNKNIISFTGADYQLYGGAEEYVVNDISKYPTLRDIWEKANSIEK
jgi:hypothetical protein